LSQLCGTIRDRFDDPEDQFCKAAVIYEAAKGADLKTTCTKFLEFDLEVLAESVLHNICEKLVTSYKGDNFPQFFEGLEGSTKALRKNPRKLLELKQRRPVLLSKFESAFECDYHGENALKAFLEYLDRRWLTLVSVADGTTRADSYCGTIVQSSCSGKSRLVSE
jgi:hypothetical protein